MRLLLLVAYMVALHPFQLSAQQHVELPDIKRQLLPDKGLYRFPAFTEGTIVFRNGVMSSSRLNYNISLDEMHFINQQGDTLSILDPLTIDFISLNGSRFYYYKGYLQAISTTNGIILAFKQFLLSEQETNGGYDISRHHEGAKGGNLVNSNGQTYIQGVNGNIYVTARENYFFGDKYGHFTAANKNYLLKHFSNHQAAIKTFIKTNHISFNKLEDLLKLMNFCSEPGGYL